MAESRNVHWSLVCVVLIAAGVSSNLCNLKKQAERDLVWVFLKRDCRSEPAPIVVLGFDNESNHRSRLA